MKLIGMYDLHDSIDTQIVVARARARHCPLLYRQGDLRGCAWCPSRDDQARILTLFVLRMLALDVS